MNRRSAVFTLISFFAFVSAAPAQDVIFTDGFEWASVCAWSNDLWYPDFDNDEFGNSESPGFSSACPPPEDHVANSLDCDDLNPTVFPGALEFCNGDDDDCDDVTDEGDLCGSSLTCCEGSCSDLEEDVTNCGACGVDCETSQQCCGGGCTHVLTDALNCGSCGIVCDLDNVDDYVCVSGTCEAGSCVDGFADCNQIGADGCEMGVWTDPLNCGSCGAVCDLPNTTSQACVSGLCEVHTCDMGFADCNAQDIDGCEVDFRTDVENCGGCGEVCDLARTAAHTCVDQVCQVLTCDSLFGNCDGQNTNGCETYLADNPTNCGSCGSVCPGWGNSTALVRCSNEECSFACRGERYDVDDNPNDGCERGDSPTGNHVLNYAVFQGSFSCSDSSSNPDISGMLVSDRQIHTSPTVIGFNESSGSAPDWYRVYASGGFCNNDIDLQLEISSSHCATGYRLTVQTDKYTWLCDTGPDGVCRINHSGAQYSDDSDIFIIVSKTAPTSCIEFVDYTVTGHF